VLLGGCAVRPVVVDVGPGGRVEFQSLTFRATLLPTFPPDAEAAPVAVTGRLSLPPGVGRVPAVVLAHGCSGAGSAIESWADEMVRLGYAALVVDSYAGRGLQETCSGRTLISNASRLVDVYRALDFLTAHPRVDPARIVLLGFSQGGRVALWATYTRFRARWLRAGSPGFRAYLAFYPGSCWYRLHGETEVGERPIRVFHGAADDWTPLAPCRAYVERLRRAGRDAALFEYPGAHHGFDSAALPAARWRPAVLNPGRCDFVEQPDGRFVEAATGQPPTFQSPCLTRGATVGYQAEAYRRALEDVRAFLRRVF